MISRYLIDCEPTNDLIERYCLAMQIKGQMSESDDAEWHWVCRYPRSLRYLDAATGLVRPHSSLRRRLHLMMAVLETSPAHARHFLPRPRSVFRLITNLTCNGARVFFNAAIGLPMLAWARRHG
jgi:hypothetical protein